MEFWWCGNNYERLFVLGNFTWCRGGRPWQIHSRVWTLRWWLV